MNFKFFQIIIMLCYISITTQAAIFKVAKDTELYGAQFSSMQDAVNACNGISNYIIILDNEIYEERVEITKKRNITITSSAYLENPNAVSFRNLPTISFYDSVNTHPHNLVEGATPELSQNYLTNGAISIYQSQNITISGIIINGGETPRGDKFIFKNVWKYTAMDTIGIVPLIHGNTGISIVNSKQTTISSCEIKNCFFATLISDNSKGDIFSIEEVYTDESAIKPLDLSTIGTTGNHIIEKNHIYDNSYAVSSHHASGMGSIFRNNLVYNNYGRKENKTGNFFDQFYGGAFVIKDHVVQPWQVYNNTFYRNNTIIHHSYYRSSQNFMFASNIFGKGSLVEGLGVEMGDPGSHLIVNSSNLYNNIFQPQSSEAKEFSLGDAFYWRMSFGDGFVFERRIKAVNYIDVSKQNNDLVVTTSNNGYSKKMFVTTDIDSIDFLVPYYRDDYVSNLVKDGGYPRINKYDKDGTIAERGALCQDETTKEVYWSGVTDENIKIIDGSFATVNKENIASIVLPIEFVSGSEESVIEGSLKIETILLFKELPYIKALDDEYITDDCPRAVNVTDSVTNSSIQRGANTLSIKLPNRFAPNTFSLFHVTVSYIDNIGKKQYSNIGVFPTRNFTYEYADSSAFTHNLNNLSVTFEDALGNKISEITVGEELYIHALSNESFTSKTDETTLNTLSGNKVLSANNTETATWCNDIGNPISFSNDGRMKIIIKNSGTEVITMTAVNSSNEVAIGVSNALTVHPATPYTVSFCDPAPGKGINTYIMENASYKGSIDVLDMFSNIAISSDNSLYSVDVESSDETMLIIEEPNVALQNNGKAYITLKSIGSDGDIVKIRSKLHGSNTWQDSTYVTISTRTSISELTEPISTTGFSMTIAANPMKKDGVFIIQSKEAGVATFIIYTVDGSAITAFSMEVSSTNPTTISHQAISQLQPGTYFVEMIINNERKIIDTFTKVE